MLKLVKHPHDTLLAGVNNVNKKQKIMHCGVKYIKSMLNNEHFQDFLSPF